MRIASSLALLGLATAPVTAARAAPEMAVTVEVPQLSVAEYHRPYVAIWVERPDQQAAANLSVWYDAGMRNREGEKWLKDMRQWWRRTGRTLQMPVDGVTGATRAPGRHTLRFDATRTALSGLEPGQYNLVVEAAREVGGRELLRVPFQWPPTAPHSGVAQGENELGTITVQITP
ncbi:DUF2271 domain-containing protein [Neoroseomonas lacus]|uniref:DUF2271 domain-containing protein n=1 Tax=Neoroseomonas lacus TaxID=287609 RepID=A0A917L4A4_9PROT|nr:DUF2271 domain-containing protein [Neoroseomonas lacus]GGJ42244.1 hypothetical protein GCM10011320_57340 [Neoroseomonas lacus]